MMHRDLHRLRIVDAHTRYKLVFRITKDSNRRYAGLEAGADDWVVAEKRRDDQAVDALADKAIDQRGLARGMVIRVADEGNVTDLGKPVLDRAHDWRVHGVAQVRDDHADRARTLRA